MAIPIKHLTLRDGVYYYVRRIPKIVAEMPGALDRHFGGQHTVRISLLTKDPLVAARKAQAVSADFERKVAEALGQSRLPEEQAMRPPLRRLTQADLSAVRDHLRRRTEQDFRQLVLLREMGGESAQYADEVLTAIEMDAEHTKAVLLDSADSRDPRLDMDAATKSIAAELGLDVNPGDPDFVLLRRAVKEGEYHGRIDGFDIVAGRKSVVPADPIDMPGPAALKMSAVMAAYIDRQRNPRTIVGIREAAKRFIAVVGDLPLDQLNRSHFQKFCAVEAAGDIGGRSRGSVQRPRSAGTIQKKLTFLSAAIRQAIDTGKFSGSNPAAGVAVEAFARPVEPRITPAKRPFTVPELNSVLSYPWFTGCKSPTTIHAPGTHRLSGMWYWGPVLAMLTGCRAGELGGLQLDEIFLDDPHPHILIRNNQYRTTKGGYARKVPLVDQMIELGFGEFVEHRRNSGGDRLFNDWLAPGGATSAESPAWSNGKMVRAFNTTLVPVALKASLISGARREVTFHSFRGAFKTLLHLQRYGIQMNYINEVIGHSKNGLDERYIGEIPIEETYPAVRGCRYDGLHIPPAPTP